MTTETIVKQPQQPQTEPQQVAPPTSYAGYPGAFYIDPETKKKQIRINPSLTEESLQGIVIETRSLIINLYLTCEVNYVNGLNIYEAIVDQKILDTLKNQTQYLYLLIILY